jgi:transposase
MTAVTAANLLGLSRLQVHRLLMDFQTDGPAAMHHKARGRRSNNRIDSAVREFAVTLVSETYIDFGPTFTAKKLAEDHSLKVSRETLRKWMQDAGIRLSRKQRCTFNQPRLSWEAFGELIQIDGSDNYWFEDRGPRCTLLVFIDDTTSTLMQLRFVMSESTFSYFGRWIYTLRRMTDRSRSTATSSQYSVSPTSLPTPPDTG